MKPSKSSSRLLLFFSSFSFSFSFSPQVRLFNLGFFERDGPLVGSRLSSGETGHINAFVERVDWCTKQLAKDSVQTSFPHRPQMLADGNSVQKARQRLKQWESKSRLANACLNVPRKMEGRLLSLRNIRGNPVIPRSQVEPLSQSGSFRCVSILLGLSREMGRWSAPDCQVVRQVISTLSLNELIGARSSLQRIPSRPPFLTGHKCWLTETLCRKPGSA